MRPRQSSLGIERLVPRVYDQDGGFNEAEAIKPRNLTDQSQVGGTGVPLQ